ARRKREDSLGRQPSPGWLQSCYATERCRDSDTAASVGTDRTQRGTVRNGCGASPARSTGNTTGIPRITTRIAVDACSSLLRDSLPHECHTGFTQLVDHLGIPARLDNLLARFHIADSLVAGDVNNIFHAYRNTEQRSRFLRKHATPIVRVRSIDQ